jgi:hypothetical protein
MAQVYAVLKVAIGKALEFVGIVNGQLADI